MTRSPRLVFPALISAGLLWGTTVPLSKLALGWLSPASLAFIRFALAAALLMVVSRGKLRAAVSPAILVSGALGYGGSVVLQNFGVERTSVTHAALLIGATPVLVAILAAVFGHSLARPAAWAGFGLSLAGVAVIAAGHGGGASLGGDALVLAGQLASAGFTVAQARLLPGRDAIAVTAVQLGAAAVLTLPLALLTGRTSAGQPSLTAVLATAGLVLAGTVAPTAMFAFGQSRVSADVAGAFLNLEPLVGAVAGVVVFADPFGLPQALGGIAILAGIALSSLQVMRATSVRPERPTTVSSRATDGNVAPDPTALGRFHARVPTPIAVRRSQRRRSASRLRRGSHALRGEAASRRLSARPPVQRSRPGGTTAGQYERHHGRFAVALTAAGFPPCCSEPGPASSTAETTSQSALARMNAYSPDRTRF